MESAAPSWEAKCKVGSRKCLGWALLGHDVLQQEEATSWKGA